MNHENIPYITAMIKLHGEKAKLKFQVHSIGERIPSMKIKRNKIKCKKCG